MRLLVVGGGGFVGGRLVRLAVARGATVTVLEESGRAARITDLAGRVRILEGVAGEDLRNTLGNARPDAAVWAAGHNPSGEGLARAAVGDVAAAVAGNAGAFAAFLTACTEVGIPRVVACGSSVVYGPAPLYPGPVDEDAAPAPMTAYGLSKLMAEAAADWARRARGLDVTTVRLPLVLGPGRWYGGATAFLDRMLDVAARGGAARESTPAGSFDGMHGDDAATALLSLARRGGGPLVLNLTGFVATWADAAAILREMRPGMDLDLEEVPAEGALPLMDGARLRAILPDFVPRDLRTTLADALAERMEGVTR